MRKTRLILAAACLATALTPAVSSATGFCTIWWRSHETAVGTVKTPYCVW